MTSSFPPDCPSAPTHVEPQWLNWHLKTVGLLTETTVKSVQCEPIGASVGFLSRMARIVPEYSEPTSTGPASMILKMETREPNFRAVANRLRAFDREVGFYRHVAPGAATRLPRLYASDAAGGGGWMLMEDLSHLENGDQVHGLTNAQVTMALKHMAVVHAASWNQQTLADYDWLPDDSFWFREDLSEVWPKFREHYQLRIGSAGTALIEQVLERSSLIDAAIAARPRTLVHGDLRADNLLLGKPGSEDEVLILDWQTTTRSLGAIDVAMLIGGSEPPPERAGHYQEIFDSWRATLLANGVVDYQRDHALQDLRLALLSCLRIPLKVFAELGGPDFKNAREAQLADVFILRHTSAALEFEAASAMP